VTAPHRWLHRLGFGEPRPDESAALEIEHHLAEDLDRLVAEGWAPDEARREAERRFGDREHYVRLVRRLDRARRSREFLAACLELLGQTVRSVVRTARREPGFTAAVVVTLALGIGANATMYGIIDRLMLKGPEHLVRPNEVVRVLVERPDRSGTPTLNSFIAYPDYVALRSHRGFAAVAAYLPFGLLPVGRGNSAGMASVAMATAELFPLLGVQPRVGRFFTGAEAQPGATPTAVIGFEYWRSVYAAETSVIGQRVAFADVVYTIVGVAPPGFTGVDLRRVDVWIPLEMTQVVQGGSLEYNSAFQTVARLAEDAVVTSAESEATRLHVNSRRAMIEAGQYSDRARIILGPLLATRGPEAAGSLSSWGSADLRVVRWLSGVSLVVLLIACGNVANLLMVRATRQRRAIDVRLALGAGRGVVAVNAVLEALVLAFVGGVLALAIAGWGGDVVRTALLPDVLFPASALTPRTIAFTIAAVVVAGLSSAVLPVLFGALDHRVIGLQGDGPGMSPRRSALRGALTGAQAAMTVVLLVGAGLFLRSLRELRSVDLGLDVDRLAMAFPQFPHEMDPQRRSELIVAGAEVVAALPSVEAAAATSTTFQGGGPTSQVRPEGVDSVPRLPGGGPYVHAGTPSLFATMGLAVTRGRGIERTDVAGSEPVAVVSQTMANHFWPAADPVGECLLQRGDERCAFRVVGVVEDAARNGFFDPLSAAYYIPAAQATRLPVAIYVRARGRGADVVDDVARALRELAPEIRMVIVETVRDRLDPQARSWTLGATMFTIFGLLALVVAAIGLYSVLAFDVAQRTRELGIRTALGARKTRLIRSVVSRGALMGSIGIVLGLAAAYLTAPYIQDLLFETSPHDPTVFVGVAAILLAVSVVASLAPALRATRVDPVKALRTE
jgi:predicted permease